MNFTTEFQVDRTIVNTIYPIAKTCPQLTLKTVPVARSDLTTPLARRIMRACDRDLFGRVSCQHRTFKQA